MTQMPRVVVLVLNWCAADDSIACIESLQQSTYPEMSILVIDNGSPDGSGRLLHERFPTLLYLQTGANLGYAGGNNRGFEAALAAEADYVLVLNNDTVVDSECVQRLVETAIVTGAGLVAPKILYHEAPELIWYAGGDFSPLRALGVHRRQGERDNPREAAPSAISFATGCCFLVRVDVVRRIGGFDESYFAYVEDAEFSVRVARAGFAMLLEPRARLLHKIPVKPSGETPFQIRQRDRNRRRLARKHLSIPERLAFAVWFYPTRLIHLGRYILHADWPRVRAILAGSFGLLRAEGVAPSDIHTRAPIATHRL